MIAAIAVALVAIGFFSWRGGLALATVVVIVEGALRKWVFPEQQTFFYWTKDILLVGVYLRFYGARILTGRPLVPRHPLWLWISALMLWGVAAALNPNQPTPLVGLLGFKAYFFYVPLFHVASEAIETRRQLLMFLVFQGMLAIAPFVLGVVQFFSPPTSVLVTSGAWGTDYAIRQAAFIGESGEFNRISGPFSYISGHVYYSLAAGLVLLALLHLRRSLAPWHHGVLVASLCLAVANLLMTGSRFAVFTFGAQVPLFLLLTGTSVVRLIRVTLRLLLVLAVVGGGLLAFVPDAPLAFVDRVDRTGDTHSRIQNMLVQPFEHAALSWPWGVGLGTTHQAARFLTGDESYSWVPTQDFEDEPGRIMLELGPLGFLLFYAVKLRVAYETVRTQRRLRDPALRTLAAVPALLHLGLLPEPTVFNITAAFYYWLTASWLVLLPRLEVDDPGDGRGVWKPSS